MNRSGRWIVVAVLALIGTGVLVLARFQRVQRLGPPGVRLVSGELYDHTGKVAATNLVYLPESVLSMTSTQMPVSQLELNWLPPDTTFGRRRYSDETGFGADIGVVLMGTDRTSIHQPQYCLTGQGFVIDRTDRVTIPMSRPVRYELDVMRLTATYAAPRPDQSASVWRGIFVYWFVADNQLTADHGTRMWWLARDVIVSGVMQRWAYVYYFAVCRPGQEDATYARLEQMIQASAPEFQLVPRANGLPGPKAGKD